MHARTIIALLVPLALAACGDEKKRPLGESCGAAAECESGLCLQGQCLDPDGDEDLDGLTNALEGSLGTNPLNPDTDYDGVADGDELDGLTPRDTDGDGFPDILESAIRDADSDCIPDELDAENGTPSADPRPAAAKLCGKRGVCAAYPGNIVLVCDGGVPRCDYANIAQWQSEETSCDGLDNDCDGATDEGSPDRDGDTIADCIDPDRDGDDAANAADNCPEIANADQADADADGRGDACDAPGVPTLDKLLPDSPTNMAAVIATGLAEPFATVTVFTDPACANAVGSSAASADGGWSASVTLAEGTFTFSVQATNRAGLVSSCVPTGKTLTIDRTAPQTVGDTTGFAFRVRSYDEGSAVFVIEGTLAEPGTIEVFTDAACAERGGAAESDALGRFSVELPAERADKTAYAKAFDLAGNASPCVAIGALYGPISVSLTANGQPLGDALVQFHYPDGAPMGDPVTADEAGLASVEGFAGFGLTFARSDNRGTRFRSVLGLMPGEVARVDDTSGNFASESFYVDVPLSWPTLPDGTAWLSLVAPCGDYYLSTESASVAFWDDCFSGATYDAALVARAGDGTPLAYLLRTQIARPTRGATLAFEGTWQTTGWYDSELEIIASGAGADWSFGVGLESLGQDLVRPESNGRSGYVRGGMTVTATNRLPPLPGATAIWVFQTSHLLANGGRGTRAVRAITTPPVAESIDLEADLLPRVYAFESVYAADKDSGVPIGFEWLADPGLAAADALVFDLSVYTESNFGSFTWSFIARPSEATTIALPRFGPRFPYASAIGTAYASYIQTAAWYEFGGVDHFAGLLEACAFGAGCDDIIYGTMSATVAGSLDNGR